MSDLRDTYSLACPECGQAKALVIHMTQLVRISAFGERPLTEVITATPAIANAPSGHWSGIVGDCQTTVHESARL